VLVIESFLSPHKWRLETFSCHTSLDLGHLTDGGLISIVVSAMKFDLARKFGVVS
jgi:hypothetical protein